MSEKSYEVSEELGVIAKNVLSKDKEKVSLDYNNLNIVYLKVYPNISKSIVAQCIRPGRLLKYFSEADIIIQVDGTIWDSLNDEAKYVLMLHEMKHVNIEYKKDGSMIIKLRNHDVQDFSDIINKYGINWFESIRSISASVNDFQNGEEYKIKI